MDRVKVARALLAIAKDLLVARELKGAFDKRYMKSPEEFKSQNAPGVGKPSKFGGCVNYFMKEKGFPQENAHRMCGYIKKRKEGVPN